MVYVLINRCLGDVDKVLILMALFTVCNTCFITVTP